MRANRSITKCLLLPSEHWLLDRYCEGTTPNSSATAL